MESLGIDAVTVEFIATSVTTWSGKINMIINSIAIGMTVSLIPAIVESFTLKNWKEVNKKINTSLKMVIFISLPMAIGLSMLSNAIWSIFYGASTIGSTILKVSVFSAVTLNIYMVTSTIIQGLNKYKVVYVASITGFIVNAGLDIPIMLLFNKLGWPPYLGALVASIIGYLTASFIALLTIKKHHQLNFSDTFNALLKICIPLGAMLAVLMLFKYIYPYDVNDKISCLLFVLVNSAIGALVYFGISWKMGLLREIWGQDMLNTIKKKLTHKK